ncbi:MAG: alpha/beta fold hydrolase [archaeon]|nr:alpha/beta fold hydrolase [archaeon]
MVKRGLVKSIKEFWRKRPFLFMIIILAVILIIIIFGAKISLYFNYLLGNDTLLQLSSDKKELFFNHGEEEKITFKIAITANPFCSVYCNYRFENIGNNKIMDNNNFTVKTIAPFVKQYKIKEENMGNGQELYRFVIECSSKKSFLCQTKEDKTKRNILITVNYNLTEEDKKYVENLMNNLNNLSIAIYSMENEIKYNNNSIKELKEILIFNVTEEETDNLNNKIEEKKSKLTEISENWNMQEYVLVEKEYNLTNIVEINQEVANLKKELNIIEYNLLVRDVKNMSLKLNELKKLQINQTFLQELDKIILDFNNKIANFSKKDYLENKLRGFLEIQKRINNFSKTVVIQPNITKFSSINVSELNRSEIKIPDDNNTKLIIFEYPSQKCCVFGQCKECCINETCKNSKENYPIMFIHGHSFNKDLPIEFNLDGFNKLQDNLEKEGYLDAGVISINDNFKGSWADIPAPLLTKSSYYYDILKKEDNYITVPSKGESIDSYALRMKDIVEITKKETGRPKVIIIAHSMGGLVVRRYIQIFGGDSVDKIILIGTPNLGIEGDIATYCPIIGEEPECKDMIKNSMFMNKLNSEKPNIPVYMIVGDGCKMQGRTGDGIVLKENAILEGANNYVVNGTCKDLESLLHIQMLDPELYPEVFEIIKKALKEEN